MFVNFGTFIQYCFESIVLKWHNISLDMLSCFFFFFFFTLRLIFQKSFYNHEILHLIKLKIGNMFRNAQKKCIVLWSSSGTKIFKLCIHLPVTLYFLYSVISFQPEGVSVGIYLCLAKAGYVGHRYNFTYSNVALLSFKMQCEIVAHWAYVTLT